MPPPLPPPEPQSVLQRSPEGERPKGGRPRLTRHSGVIIDDAETRGTTHNARYNRFEIRAIAKVRRMSSHVAALELA